MRQKTTVMKDNKWELKSPKQGMQHQGQELVFGVGENIPLKGANEGIVFQVHQKGTLTSAVQSEATREECAK